MTFDNTSDFCRLDCPYDRVTVTRRYFRSGESEYLINRKPVRLRDIYELFLNTGIGRDGYSIIGAAVWNWFRPAPSGWSRRYSICPSRWVRQRR